MSIELTSVLPAGESILFLSCDLVGSTRHKETRPGGWSHTFLAFYREFSQALARAAHEIGPGSPFRLWKVVGDEVIFTCLVNHERDVNLAVRAWLSAMHRYETETLADEGMATKGGAFIGTFPAPDTKVAVPLDPSMEVSDKGIVELNDDGLNANDRTRYVYDFIGPGIDAGFRVVSHCERRYFMLSVEVAWALCQGATDTGAEADDVIYLGSRVLDGVWGGRQYPLLAIDRQRDDPVAQAVAVFEPRAQAGDIVELCRRCSEADGWLTSIYLPDSSDAFFRSEPSDALAGLRVNAMEGAESLPPAQQGRVKELLRRNAPLT